MIPFIKQPTLKARRGQSSRLRIRCWESPVGFYCIHSGQTSGRSSRCRIYDDALPVLFGVLGGRLWYVVRSGQIAVYDGSSVVWGDTIPKVLKFTEGGLVVYGAFVGGLIGCSIFLIRRELPKLATLDLIVPALAIGMFFGRLGCFMNGCCYGGLCTDVTGSNSHWEVPLHASSGSGAIV